MRKNRSVPGQFEDIVFIFESLDLPEILNIKNILSGSALEPFFKKKFAIILAHITIENTFSSGK